MEDYLNNTLLFHKMLKKNPKISIIIVNWNGKNYLFDCLNSVYKSNFLDYEIIIIDNGSKDESQKMLQKKFLEIKLILNKKNLGFAKANNQGIKIAQGEFIFLLNNDTVIHPDLLRILSDKLSSNEKIGIVGPKIYYTNSQRIWFAGGCIDWAKGKTYHLNRDLTDSESEDSEKEVDFITGCALMIKREVIDKIGFLDQNFFAYYEDADWCQKAIRAGYRVVYLPFGGVWHIKSATSSRIYLDDLKKELKIDSFFNKIKIYFLIADRYIKQTNRLKYCNWRNKFVFFMRYAEFRYKVKYFFKFIFILTPKFLWSFFVQAFLSLLKVSAKHILYDN